MRKSIVIVLALACCAVAVADRQVATPVPVPPGVTAQPAFAGPGGIAYTEVPAYFNENYNGYYFPNQGCDGTEGGETADDITAISCDPTYDMTVFKFSVGTPNHGANVAFRWYEWDGFGCAQPGALIAEVDLTGISAGWWIYTVWLGSPLTLPTQCYMSSQYTNADPTQQCSAGPYMCNEASVGSSMDYFMQPACPLDGTWNCWYFGGPPVLANWQFDLYKVGIHPCDTNCDGSVNGSDIANFIGLLNGVGTPCACGVGDTNYDGSINGGDIQNFINCLNSPP